MEFSIAVVIPRIIILPVNVQRSQELAQEVSPNYPGTAISEGKRPSIVGGIGDSMRLLEGVLSLQSQQPTDVPEFFGFASWSEVVEFSKTDDGQELSTLVNLVDKNSVKQLMFALRRADLPEDSASVVFATTHKAKGREWDGVVLTDDFVSPRKDIHGNLRPLPDEELRTLYVAMTRGKRYLKLPEKALSLLNQVEESRSYSPKIEQISSRPTTIAQDREAFLREYGNAISRAVYQVNAEHLSSLKELLLSWPSISGINKRASSNQFMERTGISLDGIRDLDQLYTFLTVVYNRAKRDS